MSLPTRERRADGALFTSIRGSAVRAEDRETAGLGVIPIISPCRGANKRHLSAGEGGAASAGKIISI